MLYGHHGTDLKVSKKLGNRYNALTEVAKAIPKSSGTVMKDKLMCNGYLCGCSTVKWASLYSPVRTCRAA